jgi:hypothetical protein
MAKATQLEARLEKLGTQLMESAPDGVRAFVYMQGTAKSPFKELWRHGSKDKGRGVDGDRVMGACRKRQRTVIVYDAEKDSQMRGIRMRTFHSALCSPIFDDTKTPIGMILMISEQAEAFAKNHRFAVERVARDYAGIIETYRKVPAHKKKAPSPYDFLYSPITLVASLAILLVLIGWSFAPGDPEPEPHHTAVPNSTVGPTDVAQDFLVGLQEGRYEDAWAMFDPALRQRWSSEDFHRAMTAWTKDEKNREILAARGPSRVQRQNQTANVSLFESSVVGDSGRWNWELTERSGTWKVTWLEGPVTTPGKKNP